MDRRKFVSVGAASLTILPFLGFASILNNNETPVKPKWLLDLIKMNDEGIKIPAAKKITDPNDHFYGAYVNGFNIPTPHSTAGFIDQACIAIGTPESIYYRSATLLKELEDAFKGILKLQHEDGTIDLVDSNFHSTPDTAFIVKVMAPLYAILKNSNTPGQEKILVLFEQFLKRAGNALATGGIHTPNHRWVVSAALVRVNEQFPDKKYTDRVNQWLNEHIDLDPDGQYTEKSTGGYSAVVDRVLITVSKGMNRPEILDAVRKNIMMMRYYLHPNGEVVTEASNRQDKGQIDRMDPYYYACRFLALKDNNGEMAEMCRMIEKNNFRSLLGSMSYFLSDPGLWKELPASKEIPTSYVKTFPYSGVVRIRRGNWDTTLLTNNAGFMTFHKGNAVLQGIRVAGSFFGKGQFQSAEIKEENGKWIMRNKLDGPYYQPMPADKISPDGDLAKMPRTLREKSNIQNIEYTVIISETGKGMQVDFDIKGTDRVPIVVELIFRRGGTFQGVLQQDKPDIFAFKEQEGIYTVGNDQLHFGPGLGLHTWFQLRGALPHIDNPTVYVTGFTPFKHSMHFS